MKILKKPNFFIVGAAKSGTSTLARVLGQHPEIFMSPLKEPYFFISENHFNGDLKEYLRLYKNVTIERSIGEATTGYLYDQKSPILIKDFDNSAKIIIVLRNPIEMAFSFWKYMRVHGNESQSFDLAILEADNRKKDAFRLKSAGRAENYLYLDRAKYYAQVKRYLDVFGRDSVMIISFEDMVSNSDIVYSNICKFLNVDKTFKPEFSVVNPGGGVRFKSIKLLRNKKYPLLKKIFPPLVRNKVREFLRDFNVSPNVSPELTLETRVFLQQEFIEDVSKLKKLTSMNFSKWTDFN